MQLILQTWFFFFVFRLVNVQNFITHDSYPSRHTTLYQRRNYVEFGWRRQTTKNQRYSTLKIRRLKCVRISTSFWRLKPNQISTKQISTKNQRCSTLKIRRLKFVRISTSFWCLKLPNINQTDFDKTSTLDYVIYRTSIICLYFNVFMTLKTIPNINQTYFFLQIILRFHKK